MKKHLSLFGLFARSSIYKVLSILGLMCVAEIVLFASKFAGEASAEYVGRFEHYVGVSRLEIIFGLTFVLITVILCLPGTEFGSKVGYTIRRLQINERAIFFHQAIFNSVVYILLWSVQIVLLYGFSIWYSSTVPPQFANNQSIFLAFYRDSFLHTVLPLSEVMLWIRNLLLVIALGFASAEFPFIQRRKKYSTFIVPVAIYTLLFFACDVGAVENIAFSILLFVIVVSKSLYDIYHKEESYDK